MGRTSTKTPMRPGSGNNGLRGKFSEIDYTFAYDHSLDDLSVGGGLILYTFPDRFDATAELYGVVGFDAAPLAPSVTLYVDVDETRADEGGAGVYVNIAAGHSFEFGHDVVTGLDLGGSLGFANGGFGSFYYGIEGAGAHDAHGQREPSDRHQRRWSAGAFVTYSGLLGKFQDGQFLDPREVYLGTAGTPGSKATRCGAGSV